MNSGLSNAEESVHALLSDVVFIAQQRPGSVWPQYAKQALDHHTPALSDHLLSPWHQTVQRRCLEALEAIVDVDVDGIRTTFTALRRLPRIERHIPIGRLSIDDPVDVDPALSVDEETGETVIDLTVLEKRESQDL